MHQHWRVWLTVILMPREMRWQQNIRLFYLNSSFTDTSGVVSTWLFTPPPGCLQSLVMQHQPETWRRTETSVALSAGTGGARRRNRLRQREQKRDVWRDSAECGAGSCQRLLQQECSASYRKEREHQREQEGRTCICLILALVKDIAYGFYQQEYKIHRAFVGSPTRIQGFA